MGYCPASETSPGATGQLASDGTYLYMCYATNLWIRFASSGWSVEVPPTNTVLPAITGIVDFEEVVTSSTGSWSGSPTSYTYAWFVDGLQDVGLGSANNITITAALSETTVRCRVTATNIYGSTAAYSNEIEIPQTIPVNAVAPVLSGTPDIGNTLTCSNGTWYGAPTSYTYAWFVDNIEDPLLGTASTLLLTESYTGTTVKCEVTATNATGSTSVFSNSRDVASGYTPGLDFSSEQNSMYITVLTF